MALQRLYYQPNISSLPRLDPIEGELVGKGSNMEAPQPARISPLSHPVHTEFHPVSGQVAFDEYRAAFLNESAHMPEVSLRYLIALVLSDAPQNDIKEFVCQCRAELNEQRLALFLKQLAS